MALIRSTDACVRSNRCARWEDYSDKISYRNCAAYCESGQEKSSKRSKYKQKSFWWGLAIDNMNDGGRGTTMTRDDISPGDISRGTDRPLEAPESFLDPERPPREKAPVGCPKTSISPGRILGLLMDDIPVCLY